jgi:hypothetical protein
MVVIHFGTGASQRVDIEGPRPSPADAGRKEQAMSRDAARVILDTVLRHGAEQDAVLSEIQERCTVEDFNGYKQMIGHSMGAILDVINSIVARYPDLKPPQMK